MGELNVRRVWIRRIKSFEKTIKCALTLVVCSRVVCNDVWDRDKCVFSNVREHHHLTRSLVEWLHRKSDVENTGEL